MANLVHALPRASKHAWYLNRAGVVGGDAPVIFAAPPSEVKYSW